VERRRVLVGRLDGVGDGLQSLVVHVHEVEGVVRRVAVRRDDGSDRLPLVADLVAGEQEVFGLGEIRHAVDLGDVARDARGLDVLVREHGDHVVVGLGGLRVDVLDAGVGVLAAHEGHVQHPRPLQVVEVVAVAGDEFQVLAALHGVADGLALGELSHRSRPPLSRPPTRRR